MEEKKNRRKPLTGIAAYEFSSLGNLMVERQNATDAHMLRRIFDERLEGVREFMKFAAPKAANETRATAQAIDRQNRLSMN